MALVLASSALAGCTATGGYPILDRPAERSDRIPSDFGDDQLANMDRDSARFAGEFESNSLYLLRSDNGDVCLAVYPAASAACGGNGNFTMGLTGVGTFDVAPAPRDARDGFVLVGENILASNQ
jgi:hypothetical protein